MRLKVSSAKRRPFCLGLSVLTLEIKGISTPISNKVVWSVRIYDDVIKWKYYPRYWPFVRGIPPPPQWQWCGALMFSLISAWTNGWANNRDDGDLRRHRPHYDVTLMYEELSTAIETMKKPKKIMSNLWWSLYLLMALQCFPNYRSYINFESKDQ